MLGLVEGLVVETPGCLLSRRRRRFALGRPGEWSDPLIPMPPRRKHLHWPHDCYPGACISNAVRIPGCTRHARPVSGRALPDRALQMSPVMELESALSVNDPATSRPE